MRGTAVDQVRTGPALGGLLDRLLRRGAGVPDRDAWLENVSEVTDADGVRHVVELYTREPRGGEAGSYWVVQTSYGSDGARTMYRCTRHRNDGGKSLRGVGAFVKSRRNLDRHGLVIHREPCRHCGLGTWRTAPDHLPLHAANDLSLCPDGSGNDCRQSPTPTGFGRAYRRRGSCW